MLFPQVTYPVVVWGLFAGIAAAVLGSTASRFRTGRAIRALTASGAASPESAKTAAELDLSGGAARALGGALYGKLFFCANVDVARVPSKKPPRDGKRPRLDMQKARFYLPREKQAEALERFPKISIPGLVAALVLLTAGFVLLSLFLPSIVDLVTSTFTA